MTDNQKRAHDFSIAMLPNAITSIAQEASKNNLESINIDVYKAYKALYNETLKALDRDFPDGK